MSLKPVTARPVNLADATQAGSGAPLLGPDPIGQTLLRHEHFDFCWLDRHKRRQILLSSLRDNNDVFQPDVYTVFGNGQCGLNGENHAWLQHVKGR